jgi:hypothetical protein
MKTGRVLSCKANGGRENLNPLHSAPHRGYASTVLQVSSAKAMVFILMFEVLRAMIMAHNIFYDVTPCSMVELHRRFGKKYFTLLLRLTLLV